MNFRLSLSSYLPIYRAMTVKTYAAGKYFQKRTDRYERMGSRGVKKLNKFTTRVC